MINNMKKPKIINSLLDELRIYNDHYVYLSDLVSVYSEFNKFNSAKSKAPNSILIMESACIDAMMMEFAKFYDGNKNSKNISSLLAEYSKDENLNLFTDKDLVLQKINEFKDKIKKDEYFSKGIEILKMRRNKYLAHNDPKFFGNQEKDDTYLSTSLLCDMKKFIKEIIDFFYSELGENVDSLKKPIYDGDLKNIYI